MVLNLWKMVGPIPFRTDQGLALVSSFGTGNFAGYSMRQPGFGVRVLQVLAAQSQFCLRRINSAVERIRSPPFPGPGIVRVVTHLKTSEAEELELLPAIANCLHPISSSALQCIEIASEFDVHSVTSSV